MSSDTPLGEVWGFAQTTNAGKGYWYRISSLARRDDAGRALARVITTPFNFNRNIIVCPHGAPPPGASPDASYPLLRRAGTVESDPDTDLVVMWGHSQTFKNGKGYYEQAGVGWFDRQGRAHGKFDLSINTGFKGYIAICPLGIDPPKDPMPPTFTQSHHEAGATASSEDDEDPDGASDLL
jgi:hypothetical protein